MNIKNIINNMNIETQSIVNNTVYNIIGNALTEEKINNIIKEKLKIELKNRPRIFTYNDKIDITKTGEMIKNGDIIVTFEDWCKIDKVMIVYYADI